MIGSTIKVVATAESGNTFESEETAEVEAAEITILEVNQTKADAVEVIFDQDVSDLVNKDNLIVERVDGLDVIPVNALEWSEDGEGVIATLSKALEDGVDYQVSYEDSNAVSFTASVGEVDSIVILTASAEENTTTDIKFVLLNEEGVDITSSVDVDTTCGVDVEGVDGAVVVANTSKPSASTVKMDNVGDKAKVTVTYFADDTVEPATGTIECKSAKATIGKARFKEAKDSGLKVWTDDASYCAKFYEGTDGTNVSVTVGDTNNNIYFCAEDLDKPGTIISYDSYEVSSSNDDIMSADTEDDIDNGKYCRIIISGNTVGSANIRVKASKNGADYTYTIPVTVKAEKKLTALSVSPNRTKMSNAIDQDYYGEITVTAKYSDGSSAKYTDYISEIVDGTEAKNQKLSANLLSALNETQDVHTNATARGAQAFGIVGKKYTAYGCYAQSYTIKVSTTNEDGKEITGTATVKVEDVPTAAWNAAGDGAKMEYSMEFTKGNVLTEKQDGTIKTTAKLAAYADKKFAGYVRESDAGDGTVMIGTGAGYAPATNGTKGYIYLESAAGNHGNDGYVILEEKTPSATNYTFTYAQNGAKPEAEVEAVASEYNGEYFKFVAKTGNADKPSVLNGIKVVFVTGANTETNAPARTAGAKLTKEGDLYTLTITSAAADQASGGAETQALDTTIVDGLLNAVDVSDASLAADTKKAAIAAELAKIDSAVGSGNDTAFSSDGRDYKAAIPDGFAATVAGAMVTLTTYTDTTAAELVAKINGQTAEGTIGKLFKATAVTKEVFEALSPRVDLTNKKSAYVIGAAPTQEVTGAGQAHANEATTIKNVYVGVKYGDRYSENGLLYNGANNVNTEKKNLNYANNKGTDITLVAEDSGAKTMYVGKPVLDSTIARPGTYTVTFFFTMGITAEKPQGTAKQAESAVTVKNAYVAPKVTVNKRTLDTLSVDEVRDAISISCDINNNTSAAASFNGTVYKNDDGNIVLSEADSSKWVATYIGVEDQGITFVAPANATFKTE